MIVDNDGQHSTKEIKIVYRLDQDDLQSVTTEESDAVEEESEDEAEGDQIQDNKNTFDEEIKATIMRQITEGHSVGSSKVEINSARFSHNKTLGDCVMAIVPVLVSYVLSKEHASIQLTIKELDTIFTDYSDLLKSFIITSNEQLCIIESIEK